MPLVAIHAAVDFALASSKLVVATSGAGDHECPPSYASGPASRRSISPRES
jgi:hypothetical protein